MKNSIEEDIKNAEHFIKSIKTDKEYKEENGWHGYYNKEIVELARILQHILSDYKRVLKENEQLRTEVNSLRKENEELKEERQIVGIPVRNKRDRRIGIVLHQWESGSVAVLESINPRVINTHDSWNTLEIVTDEVKQTPPPEPQLPTKTICESFSKKVRNK